jgi:SagB-type dehydrogenase family enzyme
VLPRPGAGHALADLLRYSLGLSAWKQFRGSRWSLRVNPSSGNLHPTEAYLVVGAEPGLGETPAVYHYAPDRHVVERRCTLPPSLANGYERRRAGSFHGAVADPVWLIALTSIQWREAWKYGERAFRYCQHDLGHAIAAIRIAAALAGLGARILPDWSQADIASLTGIDRDEDFVDAEREEPACLLEIGPMGGQQSPGVSRGALLDAVRAGVWTGHANQLSEDHVQWTFIDEIAAATRDPGRSVDPAFALRASAGKPAHPAYPDPPALAPRAPTFAPGASTFALGAPADKSVDKSAGKPAYPAPLLLQRRSAVALDGRSPIDAERFFAMLSRVMPGDGAPWDAVWWSARIHLALFVHRVDGVEPGLYVLPRRAEAADALGAAMKRDFLWEPVTDALPLIRLARGDCRRLAARVSCDQDIAADGFFSLGMLSDFDASLEEFGPSFYRQLFWESGVIGQVLYLEAEAAGARGTGIGCFYDDPVHDVLGLAGHAFQSLYHFTIGMPIEDTRLTTEPGYAWER